MTPELGHAALIIAVWFAVAQAVALRMGGNTRPPAGARQQPVQSLAAAVDFAAVDFHLFDNEDLCSAPSSQRLGA